MKTRSQNVLDISKEWLNDIFVSKNDDYGSSHTLTGQTINLWFPKGVKLDSSLKCVFMGLLTRMLDKLIRSSNLVLNSKEERIKDEKAYQTMGDLGVYGFMAAEVLKNGVDDGRGT